jgi:hypothetical protein
MDRMHRISRIHWPCSQIKIICCCIVPVHPDNPASSLQSVIVHKIFATASLAMLLALMMTSATAQTLPESSPPSLQSTESDSANYRRAILTDYYVGRLVRARLPFPATRRGLEIVDGEIRESTASASQAMAAQPGSQMIIAQVKFKSRSIHLEFSETKSAAAVESSKSPEAAEKFTTPSGAEAVPRLSLKFSRELTLQDLNVQTINRLLSSVLDLSELLTRDESGEMPDNPAEKSLRKLNTAAVRLAAEERRATQRGIPSAKVISDLMDAETETSELTIECSATQARLYLDGAFSGYAPRTVRLRAGVHAILLISQGYTQWEQSFFIPSGKATLVRAELQPIIPKQ